MIVATGGLSTQLSMTNVGTTLYSYPGLSEGDSCPSGTNTDDFGDHLHDLVNCAPNDSGIKSDGSACDAGSYCPEANTSPLTCPAGFYRSSTGAGQMNDCLPCTGDFCSAGSIT